MGSAEQKETRRTISVSARGNNPILPNIPGSHQLIARMGFQIAPGRQVLLRREVRVARIPEENRNQLLMLKDRESGSRVD